MGKPTTRKRKVGRVNANASGVNLAEIRENMKVDTSYAHDALFNNNVIVDILKERGAEYGDYTLVSKVYRDLVNSFMWGPAELSDEQFTSLCMICMKMARIVCGNPNNQDSWTDIFGYAKLAADRCKPKP